ncbi:aldehyde dehydrogenase family protein [Actinocatenispora sera]|uniref:Phenylacetaldehyde dehydrogenase n=1 Tax=Actinocatenispora sera TaxID=390989 RepID=A0A810L7B6_9ACTN|nr:aldehyde dehydrogenase family protein [Actinocatenispora sera]BCJ31039.1 phenylacetaldehyde dehydrogenase [Actinocatenispora sera]
MELVNPATGESIGDVPLASVEEADAAIGRAAAAFEAWRAVAPADRGRLLRRFAARIEAHADELAELEVRNSGHPIGNARWEAGNAAAVVDYYSAAPERLCGRQIPVAGGVDVTFHEPLGVVGIIVPWNFPMPIASWGFAPALAAGNTVVLKPAELTPLTALRLGELALDAGLPEHVFTVLPGAGPVVGQRFVAHPAVRKVCFTGSTAVGKQIMAGCADQVKRVTLELGGKSANIVFADADVAAAAAAAPMSFCDNTGQDCCARTRILVQRSAYEPFLAALADALAAVRVGDPREPETQVGPLISAPHRDRVRSYVDDAEVLLRGTAPDGPGFWYPPTVLAGGAGTDRAWHEEIFGPVASVLPFDTEADAIRLANDTAYGLSGSIWTRDLGRALRVGREVRAGNLSVNSHASVRYATPFGGFGSSGLGRELGPDALAGFTETKNVFLADS